jgi:hypothetical protein
MCFLEEVMEKEGTCTMAAGALCYYDRPTIIIVHPHPALVNHH